MREEFSPKLYAGNLKKAPAGKNAHCPSLQNDEFDAALTLVDVRSNPGKFDVSVVRGDASNL